MECHFYLFLYVSLDPFLYNHLTPNPLTLLFPSPIYYNKVYTRAPSRVYAYGKRFLVFTSRCVAEKNNTATQ